MVQTNFLDNQDSGIFGCESIFIVESKDPKNESFGTGFLIYENQNLAYIVTCAHVVNDVGGETSISIRGLPATTVALGEEEGFDLAVLQVEGLRHASPFNLSDVGDRKDTYTVVGFSLYDKVRVLRPIEVALGQQIGLESLEKGHRTLAWEVEVSGENNLVKGYSGSPLIHEKTKRVLGIVSHSRSRGGKGLAISVKTLAKIWEEMPKSLMTDRKRSAFLNSQSILSFPDFPDFFGRATELNLLLQDVQNNRISLVEGDPGIGKTYISAQLARELETEYKVIWLDKPNLSLDELMFYVNEILKDDQQFGFITTHSSEDLNAKEKIPAFIDVMSSDTSPRYAIFVDNYQNTKHQELISFIERFSTHGKSNKLILISNLPIEFSLSLSTRIERIVIPGFKEEDGVKYISKFSKEYNLAWNKESILEIIKETSGHPLAINLIIQSCVAGTSLNTVLENLLEYDKRFGEELHKKLLQGVAKHLTDEEKTAMYRFAVFRTSFKRSFWKALNISNEIGISLVRRGFLTTLDDEIVQMHPLIRKIWWESLISKDEKKFAHEKAGFCYWNEAKNMPEGILAVGEKLNLSLYVEAYHHFKSNNQQDLAAHVVEELIHATHKQERLLLGLPILKDWLSELEQHVTIDKPWLLLEIARKYEKKNTRTSREKASALFSQSYDVFNQVGDDLGASISLYYKGKILHRENRTEDALAVLSLVQNLATKTDDVPMQIRVLAKMTSCYSDLHQYDEAVKAAELAEISASSIGDDLGQALIIYRKGGIERHRSNFKEAEKCFKDSYDSFIKLGDRYRASKALSRLGIVQDRLGKYEHAMHNLKAAIDLKESLLDEYGIALDVDYLGDVYRSQGVHRKAAECYKKSLEIKKQRSDVYGLVKAYNNLSRNSLLSEQLDEAEEYLEEARKWLETLKQSDGKYQGLEGAFLNLNGDFYFIKKEYKKAVELYYRARDCFVPSQHNYARVLLSLGRVYLDSKDFGQSRAFLNEALEIFQYNHTLYHKALTLNYIAKLEALYVNLTDAEAKYLSAVDIARQINAKHVLLACRTTDVLVKILKYHLDELTPKPNDNSYTLSLTSAYRARVWALSGQIDDVIQENAKASKLASSINEFVDIFDMCSETKAIVEENKILYGRNRKLDSGSKRHNKLKEELIHEVWKEYDRPLQSFVDRELVSDVARIQIKKNLWRLVVKMMLNEAPLLSEEDYSSIASLEHSFSNSIVEEVFQQEIFGVKYAILSLPKYEHRKVRNKAKYFLSILAPLSKRLNLSLELEETEEIAFRTLFPKDFEEITDFLNSKFVNQDTFSEKIAQELKRKLENANISAKVLYRNKSPYSIYRKITERKGVTLQKVLDFIAFRVITHSVPECYRVLDILDDMGARFEGKDVLSEPLRDYIKSPKKSTGYQSIHLNVEIPKNSDLYGEAESHVVEFQIRTYAMHAHAERGESAHSHYKDVATYYRPDSKKDYRASKKNSNLIVECDKSLVGDVGRIIRSRGFDILSVDMDGIENQRVLLKIEIRRRNYIPGLEESSALKSLIHNLEALSET